MTAYRDWLTVWHRPLEGEIIAYMKPERIAECGGIHPDQFRGPGGGPDANQINQGMAVLQRWCRLNCSSPPKPVNVMGRTGFAFTDDADALMFKLTWG